MKNYSNSRFRSLFQNLFFFLCDFFFNHSLPESFRLFRCNNCAPDRRCMQGNRNEKTAQPCCSGYFSLRHKVPCRLLQGVLHSHHEKGKIGERYTTKKEYRKREKMNNINELTKMLLDILPYLKKRAFS